MRSLSKHALRELQAKKYIRYEDLKLQASDGRRLEVEFVSNVYMAGQVKVIQCNIRDITDRKEAQREVVDQQRMLSAILASAKDAVILVDDSGNVRFWNAAAETIFGYSAQEAMDKELAALITPEHMREFHRKDFKEFIAKGTTVFAGTTQQVSGLRKDGTEIPIELSITAINLKGRPHVIVTARDISQRLAAERERQEHNRTVMRGLEDAIGLLAATVETRDPYTAGHESRVAELCTKIARELGLDEDRIHGLTLATSVHDIGKIQIPAEILSKPGKLSKVEFELVKTHAQAGYEILKNVSFPWPIADMVRQHHERLDGSGYPQGLKGEQILLESRIMAVADVVESMMSHRPYRPGLGLDKALEEITNGRGVKYDADVVDACVKLMRRENVSQAS